MAEHVQKWVVVNIGCIECGVSSDIVGVFDNEAEADRIAKVLDDKLDWREGGQNSFEVFPLPEVGVISEEYSAAITRATTDGGRDG
jgi:hypothetical protein